MVLENIGITGASGMLGRHIRADLHQAGFNVFSTSRTKPKNIFSSEHWSAWDLNCWQTDAALNDLFQNAQAIVHAGAFVPSGKAMGDLQTLLDVNVRICGCIAGWALARKIPMIYISGATVYADTEQENILENAPKAVRPLGGFYGYSKLLAENLLQFFMGEGLSLTVLRPSSIYGDGMAADKMIPKLLKMAHDKQIIELTPPVDDKINFIHASDVSQAVMRALSLGSAGTYNVAYSKLYSVLELAQNCCDAAQGGEVQVKADLQNKKAAVRFDLNIDRAKKEFDFSPQVDLRSGLKKMLKEITT